MNFFEEVARQIRKTGVSFLAVICLILWSCAGSGTAAAGMQAERARSAKPQVSQVSSGSDFTAAVKADGTLWTWGGNMHGQLGDGTLPVGDGARYTPFRNAPTVVSLAPDNGAEARPGAPKMVGLYRRARINDPAALGGEPVPFMENGRTLVPLRFVSEALGAAVIRTDVGTIIVRMHN